jgi:hypothetical protein
LGAPLAFLPELYFLARLYGNFANLWVKILARRARLWVALSKIPAFHRERGFIAKTKEQNHASRRGAVKSKTMIWSHYRAKNRFNLPATKAFWF